jgi:hypothetical protein
MLQIKELWHCQMGGNFVLGIEGLTILTVLTLGLRLRRGSVISWPTSKPGPAQLLNFFDMA